MGDCICVFVWAIVLLGLAGLPGFLFFCVMPSSRCFDMALSLRGFQIASLPLMTILVVIFFSSFVCFFRDMFLSEVVLIKRFNSWVMLWENIPRIAIMISSLVALCILYCCRISAMVTLRLFWVAGHDHKCSLVSSAVLHRGQALLSYRSHRLCSLDMVGRVFVIVLVRYERRFEVLLELKPLSKWPS